MRAFVFLFGLCGYLNAFPQGNKHPTGLERRTLSGSISEFNSQLWSKISSANQGNIFYSPLSLHLAITQIYLGSPKGSGTRSELASLLQLDPLDVTSVAANYHDVLQSLFDTKNFNSTRIANRMYSKKGLNLKKNFLDTLERDFLSTIEETDFTRSVEAADKINQFVSNQTNELIKDLFQASDFDSGTLFVILNALYFKGAWKYPFKIGHTQISTFHVDNARQTNYSAMSVLADFKVPHLATLGADILELPYDDGKTSMIVVLPDEGHDIRKVEQLLGKMGLESLIEQISVEKPTRDVNVVFPKFETAFDISGDKLEYTFKQLGVQTIFDPDLCNLSEITNGKLSITKIAHKAVIKVNEDGTEAAAVTGIVGGIFSVPRPSSHFVVNRPFLVFIVDISSKLPLFAGRIVDPSGDLSLKPNDA